MTANFLFWMEKGRWNELAFQSSSIYPFLTQQCSLVFVIRLLSSPFAFLLAHQTIFGYFPHLLWEIKNTLIPIENPIKIHLLLLQYLLGFSLKFGPFLWFVSSQSIYCCGNICHSSISQQTIPILQIFQSDF